MAKSLESPTKLTEFAPLNTEAQQAPGIRSTFARWFGINNKPSPPIREVPENVQPPSRSSSRDDISVQSSETASTNMTYTEGRTLVSVLTRVSNLLAQKGTYNEAEFKQYWMPDSVSKECYECSYKFTALRRRHHCRICGYDYYNMINALRRMLFIFALQFQADFLFPVLSPASAWKTDGLLWRSSSMHLLLSYCSVMPSVHRFIFRSVNRPQKSTRGFTEEIGIASTWASNIIH